MIVYQKRMLIAAVISIALLSMALVFILLNTGEEEGFLVTLTDADTFSAQDDTDGDGVPNWLEHVTESDITNASLFPYERDIALAKDLTIDELLYGSPGEATEEIARRIFFEHDSAITDVEKEEFITSSIGYFTKRVQDRGLPAINLQINDFISKQEVFDQYIQSIRTFSSDGIALDLLIFSSFIEDDAYFVQSRKKRDDCARTLKTIPREVPRSVYDSYYATLERITFLCHALDIVFTERNPENFFYAIHLQQSGRIFEESESTGADIGEVFLKYFFNVLDILHS